MSTTERDFVEPSKKSPNKETSIFIGKIQWSRVGRQRLNRPDPTPVLRRKDSFYDDYDDHNRGVTPSVTNFNSPKVYRD